MPDEIDEAAVLSIERLRDDFDRLRSDLRTRYPNKQQSVMAGDLKLRAARLAESGMVEIAGRAGLAVAVSRDVLADFAVRFQRLLSFSEHQTIRAKYDTELKAVVKEYRTNLVVPLKQHVRNAGLIAPKPALTPRPSAFVRTAFVGHSFLPSDARVVGFVREILEAVGITTITGEKPATDKVSEKVRKRIEGQAMFVGIFSRRDKVAGKLEWNTSTWVVEEKAYALALGRKLILLKEEGVASIGGIQGDYEYLEYSTQRLDELAKRMLQLFVLAATGFRD